MSILVHTISGAPRPWRVLLALAFKGLSYETRLLVGQKGEHKTEPFTDLNPRATVPVVESEGLVLRDSIGILAWLDRRYPQPPLFGVNATEAAIIWQTTLDACDYLRGATNDLLWSVLVLREALPEAGTERRAILEAAAARLRDECQKLEDTLGDRDFFGGGEPSAADAVIFPEIRVLQRAFDTRFEVMQPLGFGDPDTLFPGLAAWKARINALPGVAATYPPHWAHMPRENVA